MTDLSPPLEVGREVGWLTPLEITPKRTRCQCRCGNIVLRETTNLRAGQNSAIIPRCKMCERTERKRKNPFGGGGPGVRVAGIPRLGGT